MKSRPSMPALLPAGVSGQTPQTDPAVAASPKRFRGKWLVMSLAGAALVVSGIVHYPVITGRGSNPSQVPKPNITFPARQSSLTNRKPL